MQNRAAAFAEALLESDRRYFEAGAIVESVRGAQLAWLPGCTPLAAALVVQRVCPDEIAKPRNWLAAIGRAVEERGGEDVRMYLEEDDGELGRVLASLGAKRSVETGQVRLLTGTGAQEDSPYQTRPVRSEADWAAKLELHRAGTDAPDGHEAPAALWVAMERTRTAAGYMQPFLLWKDDEPAGTFALHRRGAFMRLKNLLLHPRERGEGNSEHLVAAAVEEARKLGAAAAGVFVLPSGPGRAMYRRAGFEQVSRQVEWTVPVAALRTSQFHAPAHSHSGA